MAKQTRRIDIQVTSNVEGVTTKATASTNKLAGALGGVQGAAMAATGGIRSLTAALMSSGIGAIAVAIGAMIQGLRTVITTSAEFEYQMDKLAAVTAATNEEMGVFKREAVRLGAITEYTAEQVAQLQTEFAKLGFNTQEIINATDATLDLATAAGVDLATAAATTGSSLNAFGLDTIETQRLIDVMAKSFSSSALDMSKFSSGISNAAAAANVMGVSVEETVSAMSILNNAGIDASKVGTDLRKVFTEVGKTTKADFRTSLDILAESMEKAGTKTDKMAVLTEAVGQRSAVAMSILIEQREKLDELTTSYEHAEGSVAQMAKTMRDNSKTGIDLVRSAWQGLILSIDDGDGVINKMVDATLNGFATMLNYITDRINFFSTVGIEAFKQSFNLMVRDFYIAQGAIIEATMAVQEFFGFEPSDALQQALQDTTNKINGVKADIQVGMALAWQEYAKKSVAAEKSAQGEREIIIENTEDAITETIDDANEDRLNKQKKFLEKLKTMEEDFEDQTEIQKLERRRERHLAELELLEMEETQKGELRARVNEYYDNLIAQNKRQTESKGFEKNIDEYDAYVKEKEQKEKEYNDMKMQLQGQLLDSAASMFGEETAMAKALYALKTALAIKQLIFKAKEMAIEAGAKQADTASDTVKANSKALSTLNPLIIAATAAAGGAMIMQSLSSMRKTKKEASKLAALGGGSVGGGSGATAPQAPSFNVIGNTTAGENLIASQVANSNRRPVKAYVVESEIESAQSLARNAKATATI